MTKKEFNSLLLILFSLLFCFFLSLHSQEKRLTWNGTVESKNGIKTVKNPDNPVYGHIVLNLEKKFSLDYGRDKEDIFGWVTSVELDSEDNIYLLDVGKCGIVSFDHLGKYRFSFGRKGEGPGEFRRPKDFFIDKKGVIFVLDEHMVHIFDRKGNFKNRVKLNRPAFHFFPDGEGGGITSYLFYSGDGNSKEMVVEYNSPGLGIKKELARYYEGEIVKVKLGDRQVVFHQNHTFTPDLYLTRTFDERCIFGHSILYELVVVNRVGEVLFKIEKKEKKLPILTKEKEVLLAKYVEYYGNKWPPQVIKKGLRFPSHRPFFNKIIVDDRGRIYVSKLPSILKLGKVEKTNIFDLFDKGGHYMYRVSMKVRPHLIKNGSLYNINVPDSDGNIKLQIFSITNWTVIKEICPIV